MRNFFLSYFFIEKKHLASMIFSVAIFSFLAFWIILRYSIDFEDKIKINKRF